MPRLTKIYTRTGDSGETMLGDGSRTSKTSPRVASYGDVDEANSAIGLAIAACGETAHNLALAEALRSIQQDLFDVGADLCSPMKPDEAPDHKLRITPAQITRLEAQIDEHNAPLGALESFILPGGTELSARLHLARAITRRAERRVVELLESEEAAVNPRALIYLNRLSDLLFVLARAANVSCGGDILWTPGANRSAP